MKDDYSEAARAADRARILEIESQIRELQDRIDCLHSERKLAKKRLKAYRYPVLTLPNEIVSEICVHTLPLYPICPPMAGPSSPTSLAHVCRKWRDIALGSPELWRAIRFKYAAKHENRQTRAVRSWLDRSGTYPLAIQVGEGRWISSGCLEAILHHRERWEYVNLVLEDDQTTSIHGSMPLLRSLGLSLNGCRFDRPPPNICDFPRLQAVSLSGFPDLASLPVGQLTSLTLKHMDPRNYLPILQEAVSLIDLYLVNCGGEDRVHFSLTLPRLEKLVVEHSNSWRPQNLDAFIVPSLCTLQVWCEVLGDFHEAFASLITRSGCTLQHVLVTGDLPQGFSTSAFLREFPGIRKIAFDNGYNWSEDGYHSWEDSE
ncbi:hypothetical protein FB45DRAFT_353756 [Roridomyces roridus]|uniref:F-box domain-containing protein n=1 Tax=Roridomyces roridus TaxID=1738132 RepID=A0AAD7C982_9AGAR|nr:hypothetical protein FB45DRAFT_899661 [Roridomyces roridus]KAJ7641217.1 hypothetical protein FB45DRAFT_353756 [Roridomyces roridus]